jgi:hypothetical protein
MIAAIADPPYIGQAERHYTDDPSGIPPAEVDHAELIKQLCAEYDAWALCLSSPSLPQVLTYCPPGIRIGAWVKPFASFKPNVNPAYAWEPVIFWGGRKLGRDVDTVRDWVSANITLRKGTHGAKPIAFCYWVFEFLGMEPSDTLVDLYPGSWAVTQAWNWWRNRAEPPTDLPLFAETL